VLANDEFNAVVVKRKKPPWPQAATGPWVDTDDTQAAIWLEAQRMRPVGSRLVAEAIEIVARANVFHPVRDYLSTLAWDGTERLDYWLIDHLGAKDCAYTRLAGRFFLMGMVARVMAPGCKFDYMLVLEGEQGLGKTGALQILGGPWFGNTDLRLGDKDAMLTLRGKWLYEIAELDAFARTEATHQKSFISRQVDDVRPPFGRRTQALPRQVVFCGTTNMLEWNKDPTGGRRFWSIATSEINLSGLASIRDQLFAEATHRYRENESYWPTEKEQRRHFDPEQLNRQQTEPFEQLIVKWIRDHDSDEFSVADVMKSALAIPAAQMQASLTSRVGIVLKRLGCERIERRTMVPRYIYRRPASLAPAPAAGAGDSSDDGVSS
jgi:putative DNA primase/helicase